MQEIVFSCLFLPNFPAICIEIFLYYTSHAFFSLLTFRIRKTTLRSSSPASFLNQLGTLIIVHMAKAIDKCWALGDTKTLLQVPPCNILRTNFFINSVVSDTSLRKQSSRLCISSGSWKCYSHMEKDYLPQISNRGVLKKWLCRSRISASSDDEYRSSRNIAVSLFRRYRNVIDRGGGDNLKEFISAGVNAYALGCTEEGLRKELIDMKDSGVELEGLKTYRGSTSLKSKILSEEVDECILWLSILFITILCTPQPTVVRWSSTSPVSDEILLRWKGFCALIANAYYIKGMAWLPVKTLQLEQMAVVGHAEEPAIVASRMQLVFTTLEEILSQDTSR